MEKQKIKVTVEGMSFVCEKDRLCQASSYFKAMFTSQMKESQADKVELKEVSSELFTHLVRHTETGILELSTELAYNLLPAACMLQFDETIKECENYLTKHISPENCLLFTQLGDVYSLKNLYNIAKKHALWHFSDVIQSDAFLELSQDIIQEYLGDNQLNTDSEYNIFSALARWIEHSPQRACRFEELFSVLRLDDLTTAELHDVLKHNLLKQNASCEEMVTKELSCMEKDESEKKAKRGCRREVSRCLWIFGGKLWYPERQVSVDQSDWISSYDITTNIMTKVARLPRDYRGSIHGSKACVVGTDLYVIGGENGMGRSKWLKIVWRYSSLTSRWQIVGELLQPRRHHSLLVYGHYIYVVGGFGLFRIVHNSVHRLNTCTDEWTELPALHTPVYGAAVAECQGKIYVMKAGVERWSPGDVVWTDLTPSLPFEIGLRHALSTNGKIYLGGTHASELIQYDPETQSVRDLGNYHMAQGQLALIGQKIYRVGNDKGLMGCEYVECYDLENGHFERVNDLGFSLEHTGLLSMPYIKDFR